MASIGQARIDIVADASGFGSTASKEVTKALDGVADDAAKVFDGIEADATGAFDAVGAAASDAASDVTKSFDSAAGGAGRAGDESARGFRRGMDEISRAAAKAASDAASEMDSSAKKSEGAWAGFASSVKGHISSAADSFKTMGSAAAGWASTHKAEAGIALGAIGGLAAATVGYASEAEQSYGAVASIFGDHADKIVKASKGAADAVGLSGNEYRELATVTGAMLKNMGMPMEEVTSRTQGLVEVGADLAATYGGSTKDAMEAVGSLLRGETDPIERYGISIKQADINARLAAEGLDKLEGEAGKQAKANVLLTMLTEQAGGAMGQFAREADTAAGKQERARARMQDMREEIGTNLLPVYGSLMEIGGKVAAIIGRHPKIFIAVAGAIATFAGAVLVLGTVAPIFTAISVAAGAAGLSMWGYVAAQAAAIAPALLVVAVIGAIVGAFVLLWKRSETFRDFWTGLWETVKGSVSGAVDWIKDAWGGISALLFEGDYTGVLSRMFGIEEDSAIIDRILTIRDTLLAIPDAISGVTDILFKGDFTGGIFGLSEDSKIVDVLFNIREMALEVWDAFKDLGSAVADAGWDVLVAVFESVVEVGSAVWDAIVQIGSAVWDLVQALAPVLLPILKVVGAIIGGVVVGAVLLLMGALKALAGFFKILATAISWVAENVLVPLIGVVSEVVSWLVDRFAGAVSWLAEVVPLAFEKVSEAFGAVWSFIQSAWESVGRPVFDAIVTAGKWMFAILATVVLAPLLIAWNLLSAGIKFAWETLIKPAWDALAAAATWLWETVLLPVFGFISSAWNALGAAIRWVWDNVIKVAWDLLAAGLTWLYQTVVLFYVDLIKRAWDGLGAMVMWVWENVIKKAWDALSAGLTWLWEKVVRPVLGWISDRWAEMGNALHSVWEWISDKVFGALGRGLDKVKEAFQVAVDAITRIWDGVKKAAAGPVKFVIDTVWNGGILKAWNAVAGLVGLDPQDNITHDLGGYWTGGIVPGARSVGRDNMRFISEDGSAAIGLAGGEGIAHQHVVDAFGKKNWLALNKKAARSGPSAVEGFLGGFAGGGIVPSIVGLVNRFFPGMTITSTHRNTADLHGQGKAVDFSNGGNAGTPEMKAAARFFYDNYAPMLAELIHWPLAGWQNVDEGRPYDFGAGTNSEHRNHVHVAAHSPLPEPGSPIAPIASGGGGGFFQSVVDVVKGLWDSAIGGVGEWTEGGGHIAALPGAFLKKAGSMAWDFVKEKAESIGGWFSGDGGSATQWASVASEALRRHGYGDEHLDRTLKQIQIESTGDPSAMNLTDSNARRGTPSKGLLQVIDPTYRRIRARYASAFAGLPDDIWDPLTNVTAGVGAVRADWGGPGARWPTKDGYHKGGLMGDGDGWFHKTALEPEMILSPTQTEAFIDWMRAGIPESGDVASRFAGEVVDLLGAGEARTYPVRDERGGGGSTRIVQVTQNIYGSDSASDSAGRIIDLLDRWN